MLPRRFRLFTIVAACVAAFSAAPRARSQDVAEAARKAKAKKQQEQPDVGSSSTSAKPKTYTNEDFPESGGGTAAPGEDVVGTSEKPAPGKDTAVVILSLPNSTVKRPGGALAFWSVKNTSDHWLDLTINLIVNGPCGFHTEHPLHFRLSNGGGFGDKKSMGVAMYKDNCAGEYTFELRAESFHHTLSTATTTLKVL